MKLAPMVRLTFMGNGDMSHGNPHRIRPKRGRPVNLERQEALESGKRHYAGLPCRYGHKGLRYTSTGACVDCLAGKSDSSGDDMFAYLWE